MTRISMMKLAALLALALAPACASDPVTDPKVPTVRIDEDGITPPTLSLAASAGFRIVNLGALPYQLYSYDCAEISTGVLMPGDQVDAHVDDGRTVCHFEDILAPLQQSSWGIIEVEPPPPSPLLSDGG